jgi:hypothetical protein
MNNFYKSLLLFMILSCCINAFIYCSFSNLSFLSIVTISILNFLHGFHFINVLSSDTNDFLYQARRLILFF